MKNRGLLDVFKYFFTFYFLLFLKSLLESQSNPPTEKGVISVLSFLLSFI